MIKRPFAACGISCILGCLAGNLLYHTRYCLFLFPVFLIFIIYIWYHFTCSKFLIYISCFLFLFSAAHYYYSALPTRIEYYAAQEKEITITATVSQVVENAKTGNNKIYLKQLVLPKESTSPGSLNHPALEPKDHETNIKQACNQIQQTRIYQRNGNIIVYLSNQESNRNKNGKGYQHTEKDSQKAVLPVPGNRILITITPKLFETSSNLGQYDSFRYQKTHNIHAFAYINNAEECSILDHKKDMISCCLQSLRERLAQVYNDILPAKDASVIYAVILGKKEELDNDIKHLYSQNGIAHILAISGLHISILGMGFFKICQYTHLPANICAVLSVLFVLLYGELAGGTVSVSRAAVMFFLALAGNMIGRTYDFITSISIAALYILLQNPLSIHDSGFLLSFGAVLAIAMIYPAWKSILFPKQWTQSCFRAGKGKKLLRLTASVCDSFLISFSIFLATLPVLVSVYFSYPLYSIFLNVLVLPLMSILVPAALVAGGIGFLFPGIAVVPATIVHIILGLFETMCHMTASLPGSIQLTGAVSAPQITGYYIIITGSIFLCWHNQHSKTQQTCLYCQQSRKHNNKKPLLFIPLAIVSLYRFPSDKLHVHFLDVGQGDSCVLELPGGISAAIDSGSTSISSVGTYRLLPFLKASRIASLELVFLTHMDSDHINAIQELLQDGISIDHTPLIKNLAVPALLKQDITWQKLARLAKQRGIEIYYLYAGDIFMLSGVQFQCLYPEDTEQTRSLAAQNPNAASLVLKVSYGTFDLLLTGDVTGSGEDYLIEHCSDQLSDIEVLKVAHHGSKYSTPESFLECCTPQISVISCGAQNRYGHPHKELLERLWNRNSGIISTKDSGQITITADRTGYTVHEWKKDRR